MSFLSLNSASHVSFVARRTATRPAPPQHLHQQPEAETAKHNLFIVIICHPKQVVFLLRTPLQSTPSPRFASFRLGDSACGPGHVVHCGAAKALLPVSSVRRRAVPPVP